MRQMGWIHLLLMCGMQPVEIPESHYVQLILTDFVLEPSNFLMSQKSFDRCWSRVIQQHGQGKGAGMEHQHMPKTTPMSLDRFTMIE